MKKFGNRAVRTAGIKLGLLNLGTEDSGRIPLSKVRKSFQYCAGPTGVPVCFFSYFGQRNFLYSWICGNTSAGCMAASADFATVFAFLSDFRFFGSAEKTGCPQEGSSKKKPPGTGPGRKTFTGHTTHR
jgi:hypothetical protein